MKTTQYVRQEKAIASADVGGIRQRWLWGLRLLRDPEAMASEKSLRHGVAEQLVVAATANGLSLNEREIQRRLQCARAYPTEDEIRQVLTDFQTWDELLNAKFPAYETSSDEPPADHRTDAERRHDHARALLDHIGEQGALFPLSDFEPVTTTVKEMREYAEDMLAMASSFHEHAKERLAYVDDLSEAADGDESMTWQDAQDRLDGAVS
jgi:hypothetical protein